MKDTSPQIELRMRQMISQKRSDERIVMGCSMHQFATQLITSAIMRGNPNLSSREVRRELFGKMYGQDFNDVQRDKIVKHLMSHTY